MLDADVRPSIGEVFCGATIGHWKSENAACNVIQAFLNIKQSAFERKKFLGGNGGSRFAAALFYAAF